LGGTIPVGSPAGAELADIPLRSGSSPALGEPIGRVISISGAQATVSLAPAALSGDDEHATVGRFLGILSGPVMIIGLISELNEDPNPTSQGATQARSIARLELIGELRTVAGVARFQRGIESYPKIGDGAVLMTEQELRSVYGAADGNHAHIGDLKQNTNIGVHIDIDSLVSRHFAILGTTGVGKSSGVAAILQKILGARPNLRIFLLDPHNEYGQCFGDQAQVLTPRNLRLPFWLFNFEEIVDVFFGGRPGMEDEVEILSDVIPLAKGAYLQYRGADRHLAKKRDAKSAGFTADTPVPYRIEDLIDLLDERMGKLENRSSRATHHKLMSRIQTVRNHPRYAFMFENANLGGDTMADTLAQLFRLPPDGKPMTIMQLAGFPGEVIDAVASVLCRMAFDFGLWSDGVAPLLLVCEEAHRYAPADVKLGFGPTRRALSRIAKEGRKYGVYLGLVSQRPSEIDPTIISQCSTLFVMRLSNDRDQAFIRSAVADAAGNLLSFIPSLGTREVFTFGAGIALPTRMRFNELPVAMRPNSEAAGNTRSQAGANVSQDMIKSVIERWRSASMNYKGMAEADAADVAPALPAAAPSPAAAAPPAPYQAAPVSPADPRRQALLRKPLEASMPTGTPAGFTRLR
jgi:hypothetical protein